MSIALLVTMFGTVFFILYARMCVIEANRGRRLILPQLRTALDTYLESLAQSTHKKAIYVGRYIITLSWYYSLHAFLKMVLQFLAGVYTLVEAVLHRNRDKARKIRTERKRAQRSHLTELADHKIETELTVAQKEKRRAKALSGK